MWKILTLLIVSALVIWQLEFIKTIIAWQVGVDYEPKNEAIGHELSVDSIKNVFSGLEQGVPQSNRIKYRRENGEENYENLLMNEALEDENNDNLNSSSNSNINNSKQSKPIDSSMDYEDILMAEANEDSIKKESLLKSNKAQNSQTTKDGKCSTDTLLRGNLGKLLASAKEVMDQDSISSKRTSSRRVIKERDHGLPIAKTISFNEEPTKIEREYVSEQDPIEAKQLLTDLIATADCDVNSNSNRYVTNLLQEVTHSKVKVVEVNEEYTTVRVRSGDSLSKLAARIYGDRSKFRIIYNANRDVLSNPNKIYAGLILKIPTQY